MYICILNRKTRHLLGPLTLLVGSKKVYQKLGTEILTSERHSVGIQMNVLICIIGIHVTKESAAAMFVSSPSSPLCVSPQCNDGSLLIAHRPRNKICATLASMASMAFKKVCCTSRRVLRTGVTNIILDHMIVYRFHPFPHKIRSRFVKVSESVHLDVETVANRPHTRSP